ncbi:MAG: M36 family metallopeptidase [Deltaproteobacteria bacterium]|nr:M36 family metallopeptidase [Deltaproteobacteria bacterium]
MLHPTYLPGRRGLCSAVALVALLAGLMATPSLAATDTDILASATQYLENNRQQLGLSASDIEDVEVVNQYTSRHTGVSHVYFQQRYQGIKVYNALLNLNITADGKVISVGNRFVANLGQSVVSGRVLLSPQEAVERAAADLGMDAPRDLVVLEESVSGDRQTLLSDGGIANQPIKVKLIYQALQNGVVRLAWDAEIDSTNSQNWWSVRVDAESGQLLHTDDFVDQEQYEVYAQPIESPNHTTPAPPADARTIEVDPFTLSSASPFGWHDTSGAAGAEFTITRGNNVHAYADRNANNAPDTGADAEPDGGATLDFTGALVPINLAGAPNTYVQASVANLFYWNNIIHDVLWEYGFDEPSGNFQVNNYGNGGLGNDDVQAEGQDGGGNCNANFGTPSDGARPRMQMFTCTNTSPTRDGDFDHGVVAHEYGHGVSNRLTGGPGNSGCLSNQEQMGEGWSDFLGLIFTMEPGDVATDARGTGTYLFGQAANGPGIRPAPYSTDFGVNNFTYAGITGVSVPHGVGFVWNTMIWEMTWELIADHGFNPDVYGDWTTGGNNLAFQLVIDGMKFQPCLPGFVDGRDAILAADDALTGTGAAGSGANQCSIWRAFARRGLGLNADQGSSASRADGTEDFVVPPFCENIGALPEAQDLCAGSDAVFNIGLGGMFTAPPVTLTTSGEPGASTVSFDVNPVPGPLPGTTDMTISNTAGVAAGPYTVTVTGTDTTPTVFDTMVNLNVFAGAPAAGPGLTAPADAATDEPVLPTFTWAALADATTYTLEVDDDPGFGSIDYTVSGLTGTSHTATVELDFLTTYSWRVRGDNICGGGADSAVFTFTTLLFPGDCQPGAAAVVEFEDDLEGGATGWTSSGAGDTWGLSSARTSSGANAFFAVDPVTQSDQRLISPAISVPSSGSDPTLQFQTYQAFETPNGDGRCWDAGVLEVSTDGGSNWSQVPGSALLTDPYDNIIWNDTPGNNPITNDYGATDAWCNMLQPYQASVVDISAWAGMTVNFAWRLGSDSAAGNEGWYIDDVKVQSCDAPPIFVDGFESGDTSAWSLTFP